jgi:hypothetical protein
VALVAYLAAELACPGLVKQSLKTGLVHAAMWPNSLLGQPIDAAIAHIQSGTWHAPGSGCT